MKTTTLLLCALFMAATASAQNFVFSFGGGGDAPIARVYTTSYESQTPSTTIRQVKPVSLGQGGNVFLALDWFSKKGIGGGIKLNGFFGAPFTYRSQEVTTSGDNIQYSVSQRGFSGQFIPHLSFKHDFKKVTPVLEIGMMIGVNAIQEKYEGYYNYGNQILSTLWQKGGAALGFYSSLGIWVRVSQTVRFSVAATCVASSYSPTHWERTSYRVNGTEYLNQLATSDRYGNYVKEINSSTPQVSTSWRQSLKYSAPFSNVGLNVGFAFILARHKSSVSQPKGSQEVHSF